MVNALSSVPKGGLAIVMGVSGAIGSALLNRLQEDDGFCRVIGFSRAAAPPPDPTPALDLTDEATWTPEAPFASKSRNTPFAGRRLKGRVLHTFVGGRAVVHAL